MPTLPFNKGRNWTEVEQAEIIRLRAACAGAEHMILECSHTDEGDPWCIIYHQRHQRIVIHIARIDRRYVVVVPLKGSSWTTTMKAAVDLAFAHCPELISGQVQSDFGPGEHMRRMPGLD